MRSISERRRWAPALAALAAVVILAGCGDSGTEPLPDYDPRESLDRLDAALQPLYLGEDVYDGLWLAKEILEYYGADPLLYDMLRTTGSGVLGAAVPHPEALRALAERVRARQADGEAARVGADGEALPKIAFPSSLRGRTLVWDAGPGGYVVDPNRTDAPTNGVRIVYYYTGGSGYPTASATPLGHIDLTDRDQLLREGVGVLIVEYGATIAQDREIADYTVEMSFAGNESEGQLAFLTDGDVGSGGVAGSDAVGLDLDLRFTWSDSQDYDRVLMDYRFDTRRGPLRMLSESEARFESREFERVAFDVTFGAAGAGTAELVLLIDRNGVLSGGIVMAGETVVEVSGTDGDPRFRRPRGTALTSQEIVTLEQIWIGVADLVTLVEWLGVPSDLLLLAG